MLILEHDDGSGWVKVRNSQGHEGLVPASYVGETQDGAAGGSSDSGM